MHSRLIYVKILVPPVRNILDIDISLFKSIISNCKSIRVNRLSKYPMAFARNVTFFSII